MEDVSYTEWVGCYRQGWTKGDIVEEAYSHPAKFAKSLIFKIIEYLLASGYVTKNDTILDPFGGVGLGALPTMSHGLQWVGCELEPRFVALGHQNLALWRNRFGFRGATLLQGDSRQLRSVLQAAGYDTVTATVTSPPFMDSDQRKGGSDLYRDICIRNGRNPDSPHAAGLGETVYGSTPGNLGNMKPGALVTSPPFSPPGNQPSGYGQHIRQDYVEGKTKADAPLSFYGPTPGQLAAMPMGDAVVTSPPFGKSTQVNNTKGDMTAGPATWNGGTDSAARVKQDYADYAASPGNLGHLDATVTSPPFEKSLAGGTGAQAPHDTKAQLQSVYKDGPVGSEYQNISARKRLPDGTWPRQREEEYYTNIGVTDGETFWTAAAQILAEAFQILKPGAVAVFVLKDYVRGGKIVRFCDEWRRCCERVGFVFVEEIHALLSEQHGTQTTLFGADEAVETRRVSFFRRLAEKNFGSPKIDHETVLIVKKPATGTAA